MSMCADMRDDSICSQPELLLWDKLELEFLEDGRSGIYMSRIEGFDDDRPVIPRPEWLSGEPYFAEGASCAITYFGPACAYRFESRVLRSFDSGGRRMYVLAAPESFEKIQRRKFARVEIAVSFRFKDVTPVIAGLSKYEALEWRFSKTEDLSAGGLLFVCDHEIKVGSVLAVQLSFPGPCWVFRTLAKVIRCERDRSGRWFVGIELVTREELRSSLPTVDMSLFPRQYQTFGENESNLIANVVFKEEVKIRRREYHKESEL